MQVVPGTMLKNILKKVITAVRAQKLIKPELSVIP
jgi:hypothetical protein